MRGLALLIIRAVTPIAHREFVLGATLERVAGIERAHGEKAATRWLWREAARALAHAPAHRLALRTAFRRTRRTASDGRLQSVYHDFRYAARTLRRAPGFTCVAVALLALGIGAATAVFSVVNSVLLRPLAYAEPERLYAVQEIIPEFAHLYPQVPANLRHYLEWKRHCSCFEDVALADNQELNLTGSGEPERLAAVRVTANFFSMLGVAAQVGRTFTTQEGEFGNDAVVVLGDALWRRRFGADPGVVGRTVELDGVAHVVVGVLPRAFRHRLPPRGGASQPIIELYQPWPVDERASGWAGEHNYAAVARLPRGKTPDQALGELNVLQAEIVKRFEGSEQALTLLGHLTPLQDQVVQPARGGLLLLLAAVGTVLLVACLNLGSLMLVRSTARARETAIRTAFGAARTRILRGVMAESSLIAGAGVLLGAAIAFALVRIFLSIAPPDLPRIDEVSVDGFALGFAVALSVAAALLSGTVPAMRILRVDSMVALRAGGRSLSEGSDKTRLREGLVVVEIGLSVALLVVAGLLTASFVRLEGVQPGYTAENVLTAEVTLPRSAYPDRDTRRRFYDQLVERLETQPGVASAGVASVLPLRGDDWSDIVTIEGDSRPLDQRPLMSYRPITPDYLQTLGIPLYTGRALAASDEPRRVAVLSRRAAEHL